MVVSRAEGLVMEEGDAFLILPIDNLSTQRINYAKKNDLHLLKSNNRIQELKLQLNVF